ncbi:MerR family transcriptional regulator [Saccharopolyspora rhizosphaerae]|uniref:MerR family transcriptional regulator n=1 Tax=Saccharopolyspora rhizosphaerae TaxID=2492662 RepID=UPI00389A176D
MSTAAVAEASGYSVQQVRNLEHQGVLPPATRARNGYRTFSEEHLRALRAYRGLAVAVGPVEARRAMRDLRRTPSVEGAALISSFHERLHRDREQALTTRRGLEVIQSEADTDAEPVDSDAMTIELAQALGVRSSAPAVLGERRPGRPGQEHHPGRHGPALRPHRDPGSASPPCCEPGATASPTCAPRSPRSASSAM